jgi:hypothetical protein
MMAISDNFVAQVGAMLKQNAERQGKPVDPKFLLELYTYAHNPFLQDLNETDMQIVLTEIGQEALKEHDSLDVESIVSSIRRICHPKNVWDSCHNAARKILEKNGRGFAAERIVSKANAVSDALKKAGFR